tara:strand:+ start:2104 stop:2247 length:144 start_codon:yes stop_codon:yes gene_type:complete
MIDDEEVLEWLGSDATFKDLVNIIAEIANGDYLVEDLKVDIEGYENG